MIRFEPVPVPDMVKSLLSVLIVTVSVPLPNFIVLSDVGKLMLPYMFKLLGSVSGDNEPIVTSPSGTSISLVTLKVPTACVSILVAPVKKVNSVKATWPPV